MNKSATIEKVDNGYIVTRRFATYSLQSGQYVYTSFQDAMQDLLGYFENRSTWQGGKYYGKVVIETKGESDDK